MGRAILSLEAGVLGGRGFRPAPACLLLVLIRFIHCRVLDTIQLIAVFGISVQFNTPPFRRPLLPGGFYLSWGFPLDNYSIQHLLNNVKYFIYILLNIFYFSLAIIKNMLYNSGRKEAVRYVY